MFQKKHNLVLIKQTSL